MSDNRIHETYISVDIESDGPIPGENSMLSLGAAAFNEDYQYLEGWGSNIQALSGAAQDPDTMNWWSQHPEAWKECRKDPVYPQLVMIDFAKWAKKFPNPVFVGYPTGYDFTFVYWYLIKFTGSSPFSFSALDIKTLAFASLGRPFRECTKRNFPRTWKPKVTHTHVAAQDAYEQGLLFCNILKSLRSHGNLDSMGSHAASPKR